MSSWMIFDATTGNALGWYTDVTTKNEAVAEITLTAPDSFVVLKYDDEGHLIDDETAS